MNTIVTQGIVLRRTNYGEADRIVQFLTPDHGKISVVVKGVRKLKSKMAGGVELFSISDLTFMRGRGELGTLISAHLKTNFGNIVKDITRVQLGYDLIKLLSATVEDDAEAEYFHLLETAFAALNDLSLSSGLIRIWFSARMLQETGHMPNTKTTMDGQALQADKTYDFSLDDMAFVEHPGGSFGQNEIKFMRLLFSDASVKVLSAVENADHYVELIFPLMRIMTADYLHH
jgi:DNA repair protein RecO (recombination protein O)